MWTLAVPNQLTCYSASPAGRHGGHSWLPLPASNGRADDTQMDAQSAHEWQRGGAGFREKVGPTVSCSNKDKRVFNSSTPHSPPSVYWDFAMTIRLEEIVYLHCHQQGISFLRLEECSWPPTLKPCFPSEQWRNPGVGQSGRHPKAPFTLPQRGPPAPVSHLPGDGPPSSWPVGAAALEPERKGPHE